jgi:uncharacterized Fe-S cluster-containing radical SAM superfamily protein
VDRAALKGMTRTQLEEAKALIEAELQSCVICGSEGADRYVCRRSTKGASPAHMEGALLLCAKCWETHRTPKMGRRAAAHASDD